jgi:hypothetical protein
MAQIPLCHSNTISLTLWYHKRCSIKYHLYQLSLRVRVIDRRVRTTNILREVTLVCQIYLLRVLMLVKTEGSLYLFIICIGLRKLWIYWKKISLKGNVSIFSVSSLTWGQPSPSLVISTRIFMVQIFWKKSWEQKMNIWLLSLDWLIKIW